jgi:hypothetical protein
VTIARIRYSEPDLAKVAHFLAISPSAFLRQNTLAELDTAEFTRAPVEREVFEFYVHQGIERALIEPQQGANMTWSDDRKDHVVTLGYRVTSSGHELVELLLENSFFRSNIRQLRSNVVTILISVVTSLATAWAIYFWGTPN